MCPYPLARWNFFFFWLHRTAGGIWVPQPGTEPRSSQWNCRVILPGPPGTSPKDGILGNSGIYEVGRISAFLRWSIFLDVCRFGLFFLSRKGLASLTFLFPFGIRKLPDIGGVGWRVGVNWGTWLLWQSFHHLSCNSFEKMLTSHNCSDLNQTVYVCVCVLGGMRGILRQIVGKKLPLHVYASVMIQNNLSVFMCHSVAMEKKGCPCLHLQTRLWYLQSPFLIGLLLAQTVKNLPAVQETWVWSLGGEDPLEKGMATHSSILIWRIPRTEEPGGVQSVGLQRVRHDWTTNTMTNVYFSN